MNWVGFRGALLCLLIAPLFASGDAQSPLTDKTRQWIVDETARHEKLAAGNADLTVRTGVRADRARKVVEIDAVAVGLELTVAAEFLLAGEKGRDYESIAMTTALPSDIHAALAFIGLTPGRPVDNAKLHYWPRGPRVTMTIHWDGDAPAPCPAGGLRAEHLVIKAAASEKYELLPATGLVFTGSRWRENDDGTRVCIADEMGGIATDYNDRWTLLDVPYTAPQGRVYNKIRVNPDYTFKPKQPLRYELRPDPDATAADYILSVVPFKDNFRLNIDRHTSRRQPDDREITFQSFLERLQLALAARQSQFLQIQFADDLPTATAAEFAKLLRPLIDADLVRIEPDRNHLYYEAWLPKPEWRIREDRFVQPLEIRIETAAITGEITRINDQWDGMKQTLNLDTHKFASLVELEAAIDSFDKLETKAVFFFVKRDHPCLAVTSVYHKLRDRFPDVFVFVE